MKEKIASGHLGASSVSLVVHDNKHRNVLKEPHGGDPVGAFKCLLERAGISGKQMPIVITGRGVRKNLGLPCVSEPEAVQRIIQSIKAEDIPDALVSFGGQSIIVYHVGKNGQILNPLTFNKCGSGTGDFFLQQIKRLGFCGIEEAIEAAMEKSAFDSPYVPASRCSVFCKSDCTHACNERKANPAQIVAGICKMIAGKISELLEKIGASKIWVVGGGSRIKPVMAYLEQAGYLVTVPEFADFFEAWGAYLLACDNGIPQTIEITEKKSGQAFSRLPSLLDFTDAITVKQIPRVPVNKGDECLLAIDAGSTTTKMVLIRESDMGIVADYYGYTLGQPHIATLAGLAEIQKQLGAEITVTGIIVTGSGRYLVETFLTDFSLKDTSEKTVPQVVATNEITCHAKAAEFFNPGVRTIIEIGGQDAKYTSLINGVAVDYAMNEACSAGTGSFLAEVVKEIFGISHPQDITPLALESAAPLKFGEQCSAFIESDINVALHEGASQPDIIAGLCYSICFNYINRVVGNRPIRGPISLQGGTAYNRAFCLAMAGVLRTNNLLSENESIVVSSDAGLMGAIGAALDLKERINQGTYRRIKTSLAALMAKELKEAKGFECKGCDYKCPVRNFIVNGHKVPFGGFCRRWDSVRRGKEVIEPADFDLTIKRDEMLFKDFSDMGEYNRNGKTVGLTGNLFDLNLLPFYTHFFSGLGFKLILPDAVDENGLKKQGSEFCWPVARSHGLLENLIGKKPSFFFLPHVKGLEVRNSGRKTNECCPFIQGLPYYLRAAFPSIEEGRILRPYLDFTDHDGLLEEMKKMSGFLEVTKEEIARAFTVAKKQQEVFESEKHDAGRQILRELSENPENMAVVIFGRPYNAFSDFLGANKGITRKLASLGITVIPLDFLPLNEQPAEPWMFWPAGQNILKGAELVKKNPQLFGVYLTNFSCGPDGFISYEFRRRMGSKPSLTLEFDGHTANAGFDTRIEAFVDIVRGYRLRETKAAKNKPAFARSRISFDETGSGFFRDNSGNEVPINSSQVQVVFPDMGRFGTEAITAITESLGIRSTALPPADEKCLQMGRRHSSCKECLPYNLTLGSVLKYLENRQPEERTIVFMPTASGPCRFGMYGQFIDAAIEELGIPDVAIMSLTPENRYAGFGGKFSERCWISVIVSDVFDDAEGTLRALAKDKEKALARLEEAWIMVKESLIKGVELKNFRSFLKTLRKIARGLKSIPLLMPLSKAPKILLTGEIYVRRARITTHEICERLAEDGFVIWKSPVAEWLKYQRVLQLAGCYPGTKINAKFKIRSFFERWYERRIIETMASSGLVEFHVDDVAKFVSAGNEHISMRLKGEAVLTAGTTLTEVMERFSGVITLGPFGCMPTRIASSVLVHKATGKQKKLITENEEVMRLSEIFDRCPVLSLEADGGPLAPIARSQIGVFSLFCKNVSRELLKSE